MLLLVRRIYVRRCIWLSQLGIVFWLNCFFGWVNCLFLAMWSFNISNIVCLKIMSFFQYNADVSAVDNDGRTALWYARNSGSQECIDILIRNGCASDTISTTSTAGSHQSATAGQSLSSSALSQNSGGVMRQFSMSNHQQQQSESDSSSSTATLNKRRQQQQPGAVGGTGNGNGQVARTSNAFEKLPASNIWKFEN